MKHHTTHNACNKRLETVHGTTRCYCASHEGCEYEATDKEEVEEECKHPLLRKFEGHIYFCGECGKLVTYIETFTDVYVDLEKLK